MAQPVEWVLVIFYGRSAHRATYGRLPGNRYTKDYIQLTNSILETAARIFPAVGVTGSTPLTYQWPAGRASGAFVRRSADRPHLKWETNARAPNAWRMSLAPSEHTAETIPGDPEHSDENAAEHEFELLATRGAGQPYLIAVKLLDEPATLHLRAYLDNPSKAFAWADIRLVPEAVRALAARTSPASALAWSTFESGGSAPSAELEAALSKLVGPEKHATVIETLDADTGRALAMYLRDPGHGLFFEPSRNHDAWLQASPLPKHVKASADELVKLLEARFPPIPEGDAAAETLETDPIEVEAFRNKIKSKSFEVPDSTATVKVRGSAQKAFADEVKSNYGNRCAVTGIASRDFLVASHIVPWSSDQSIRLDPANGICLSLLVDRAFERGFLLIEDDCTIRINWKRVGDDHGLAGHLRPFDGAKLKAPTKGKPKKEYLQRRRAMVTALE